MKTFSQGNPVLCRINRLSKQARPNAFLNAFLLWKITQLMASHTDIPRGLSHTGGIPDEPKECLCSKLVNSADTSPDPVCTLTPPRNLPFSSFQWGYQYHRWKTSASEALQKSSLLEQLSKTVDLVCYPVFQFGQPGNQNKENRWPEIISFSCGKSWPWYIDVSDLEKVKKLTFFWLAQKQYK